MLHSSQHIDQLFTALQECRQFIIDNIDKLPNSENVRFNALKALNEFEANKEVKPATKPVETRTIVLKNLSGQILSACEELINKSKNTERTSGDCTEKQFHAEALGDFQKMLLQKADSVGASLVFVAMNK